jgi:acyl-CoA thioester hydrolase
VGRNDVDQPYQGAFTGAQHRFALRVYFEDTDAGGVVYYAKYLRFLERARSDMLRALGIGQRGALEEGTGVYAVVRVEIDYRAPAKLEDALVIVSRVREIRAASCVIQQRVSRGGQVLVEALVTVAFLSPDGRPTRQPRAWIEAFERMKEREE